MKSPRNIPASVGSASLTAPETTDDHSASYFNIMPWSDSFTVCLNPLMPTDLFSKVL